MHIQQALRSIINATVYSIYKNSLQNSSLHFVRSNNHIRPVMYTSYICTIKILFNKDILKILKLIIHTITGKSCKP